MARIVAALHVTQECIDRYGLVNGDTEPLHYDPAYARQRGFRGTIAHGTMVLAPLFDLALKRHGPGFLRAGTLSVKWTAPVCAGDVQVAAIDEDGSIEAFVEGQPGRPACIRGTSSCGRHEA